MSGRVVLVGATLEAVPLIEIVTGTPGAVLAGVVTLDPEQRTRTSGAADLPALAEAAGVPAEEVSGKAQLAGTLRALRPDLVVVAGWTTLVPPDALAIPVRGTVGFHASLLPAHRGRAPVNWAILRGERLTGNTMMLLDAHADTGDIVDQRPIPIGDADTCATVYARVAAAGAAMLADHLPALLAGTAPRTPQDLSAGDWCPRRTPEMGILDWTLPARAVHDWVRALTVPYPGAFTELCGRRVQIWSTALPDAHRPLAAPGTVLTVGSSGVRVATGDGLVLVRSMSWPGDVPRSAGTWAQEAGLTVGTRFDPVTPERARWARGESSSYRLEVPA